MDSPGGLVLRNPCFHCRGLGLVPGWGTKIPTGNLAKQTTATKNPTQSQKNKSCNDKFMEQKMQVVDEIRCFYMHAKSALYCYETTHCKLSGNTWRDSHLIQDSGSLEEGGFLFQRGMFFSSYVVSDSL